MLPSSNISTAQEAVAVATFAQTVAASRPKTLGSAARTVSIRASAIGKQFILSRTVKAREWVGSSIDELSSRLKLLLFSFIPWRAIIHGVGPPSSSSSSSGDSTTSLRGRSGLYYSPPGTSYTIVERPSYYSYNSAPSAVETGGRSGGSSKGVAASSLPSRATYLGSSSSAIPSSSGGGGGGE